jgi:energy-coupling factor transport system ATP-binding protein
VDDEIAFGLENLGLPREEMRRRVGAARAAVGLNPGRTPRHLDALSGGAKQRVTLASILAMGPDALVADEPTANLDPAGARLAFRLLRGAARDRSLLLIEHRLDDLAGLVDRVAVLDGQGSLALEGTPARVFRAEAGRLEALGVWTPQYAGLAGLLGAPEDVLPESAGEAADLLVAYWPVPPTGRGPRSEVGSRKSEAAATLDVGSRTSDVGPGAGRGARGPLLAVECVSYRYPGGAYPALEQVTLRVRQGEYVALAGPNGAGKSTLGLLLAGVLRPATGRVLLEGQDLRGVDEGDARRRLAYVFQYPEHQFAARTVREDVLLGLRRLGADPATADWRAAEVLERFGLAALAEANPYLLSHGQKRRLSVATALVLRPEAVILDEPTFGQDRRNAEETLDLLDALHREGHTVVVITHDMTLVAERAQRAVALAAGRVVFDGRPRALFDRPDVLRRCGLRRPPVAEAVTRARRRRPEIPPAISLDELRRAVTSVVAR